MELIWKTFDWVSKQLQLTNNLRLEICALIMYELEFLFFFCFVLLILYHFPPHMIC